MINAKLLDMQFHSSKFRCFFIAVLMPFLLTNSGCTNANGRASKDLWSAIDNDDAETIKKVRDQSELNQVGLLNRKTPLQYALEKRKRYAFAALLETGANPDSFLVSNQTVTFECALLKDSFWLREALRHGADPNLWTKTHSNNAATPLAATFCYSVGSPRSVENAILLIDAGADLNKTINGRENPLSIFSMFDGWKVVLYLLEKGADPQIGPEANLFVTRLKNPGDYRSKDPDFQAVQAKLDEMNLDVANAKWNGKTWDIPKLRP